jgi:hypothetical protein
MPLERHEIGSAAELANFLDTCTCPAEGCYRGVAFDILQPTRRVGVPLPFVEHLVALAAPDMTETPTGPRLARVWLRASLGVDLLLRSRTRQDEERSGLDRYYAVDAASPSLALRRLGTDLVAVLIRLYSRYEVAMNDAALLLSPFEYASAEAAADLMDALRAVSAMRLPMDDDSDERAAAAAEAAGPDAAFCYYCGLAVARGTMSCPGCGETLEEDDPEIV